MVPIPKKRRSGVCKTEAFRGIPLVPVAYKAMCIGKVGAHGWSEEFGG